MRLEELRGEIESIDQEIIRSIRRRMDIADLIADQKEAIGLPVKVPDRAEAVLTRAVAYAQEIGLDHKHTREIFQVLLSMSEEHQERRRKETSPSLLSDNL